MLRPAGARGRLVVALPLYEAGAWPQRVAPIEARLREEGWRVLAALRAPYLCSRPAPEFAAAYDDGVFVCAPEAVPPDEAHSSAPDADTR